MPTIQPALILTMPLAADRRSAGFALWPRMASAQNWHGENEFMDVAAAEGTGKGNAEPTFMVGEVQIASSNLHKGESVEKPLFEANGFTECLQTAIHGNINLA